MIVPTTWVALLMVGGLFSKKHRVRYLLASATFFLVFSNPLLVNQIFRNWEYKPIDKGSIPLVDTGVVLGGMLDLQKSPEDQYHLSESTDRLIEALILKKEGLISNIILSGGSGSLMHSEKKESLILKSLIGDLYKWPPKTTLDTISRNTHENAVEVARILEKQNQLDRPILLITSAFHMKRAMLCFEKQGISAIAYPVDYLSSPADFSFDWILPSANALSLWEILIKEWVGLTAYKVFGYA
mgnify:CR=1 FL=1